MKYYIDRIVKVVSLILPHRKLNIISIVNAIIWFKNTPKINPQTSSVTMFKKRRKLKASEWLPYGYSIPLNERVNYGELKSILILIECLC